MAAGAHHVIVLATTGEVWTWGDNGAGQLGNDTTRDRAEPTPIGGSGGWHTALPAFAHLPGTFTTPQTITLTSATPQTVIHYTIDGATPTEASPSLASGSSLVIDASRTVKAFAVAPDQVPSAVATATYVLRVATPTIAPGTGTCGAPQTVSLASTSPDVTLRNTLDGSDPTASSPLASPFGNGTTTKR